MRNPFAGYSPQLRGRGIYRRARVRGPGGPGIARTRVTTLQGCNFERLQAVVAINYTLLNDRDIYSEQVLPRAGGHS